MSVAKIAGEIGKKQIFVDGKAVAPFAYMTYRPENGDYDRFKRFGTKLFSLSVYLGTVTINMRSGLKPFKKGVWEGYGKYDFSGFDADVARIWKGEKDVFIFPRVYIDCPEWWEKTPKNADELCRDQRGNPVRGSYASEVWREETRRALFDFISHIEHSDYAGQIIGYQIAAGGTEEWLANRPEADTLTDYSENSRAAFVKWLREKYGELSALNAAWRTAYQSFSEIGIPSEERRRTAKFGYIRDAASERYAIDFYRFLSELTADTIAYFCRGVKEFTGGKKLTGTFYGYIAANIDQDHGHHALMHLLNSGTVDFIASPNCYDWRNEPGCDWPFMSATDSVALHGGMWFAESDTRTYLSRPISECWPEICPDNGWYDSAVWFGPKSSGEGIENLEKNAARVLTNNAGTWWFDMWGGWYRDEAMSEFFRRAYKLFDGFAPQRSKAEIAVFIDERSYAFFLGGRLYQALSGQLRELAFCGAPYHIYLTEDIENDAFDARAYRLCVFLNQFDVPEATRAAIEKKLKKDGKTLLWTFMPDFTRDKGRAPVSDIDYSAFPDVFEKVRLRYGEVLFPAEPADMPRTALNGDDGLEIIAKAESGSVPGAVIRRLAEYKTVWSAAPCVPVELLRALAREAGVHIYCDSNDVVYASDSVVALCAASGGRKTIKLRAAADIRDYFGDRPPQKGVDKIAVDMEKGETKVLILE